MNKTRKHKVFDRPILGMTVAIVLSLLFCNITPYICAAVFTGQGVGNAASGGTVSALFTVAAALICLLFHRFWFRGELNGFFNARGLGRALLLGWGVLAILVFLLGNKLFNGTVIGNVGTALILGLAPGMSEEVIFRILPLSIAMRSEDKAHMATRAAAFTAILFGVFHCINLVSGADLITTLMQVLYAAAVGLLFAAIYLRTGNIWAMIVLHSLTDFNAFLDASLQQTGGVLTQGSSTFEYLIEFSFAVVFLINAVCIFRPNKREEIPAVWQRIWREG